MPIAAERFKILNIIIADKPAFLMNFFLISVKCKKRIRAGNWRLLCFSLPLWVSNLAFNLPLFLIGTRQRGLRWAMVVAFLFGLLHVVYVYNGQYGFQLDWFEAIYTKIPLATYNFAWLPASAIAFIAGFLCRRKTELSV